MTIDILFANIDLTQYHLWLVAGAGAAACALALFFGYRTLRAPESDPKNKTTDERNDPGAADDPGKTVENPEKRREHRRKGRHIAVDFAFADDELEPWKGFVVDRSSGGLRLMSDQAVEPESILKVRVSQQGQLMPWIEIEVLSCKQTPQGYELGCRFVRPPTWNLLLTFG